MFEPLFEHRSDEDVVPGASRPDGPMASAMTRSIGAVAFGEDGCFGHGRSRQPFPNQTHGLKG